MLTQVYNFFIQMFTNPNTIAFWFYWISVCLAMFRMYLNMKDDYLKDIMNCHDKYYEPELTVGAVLGYVAYALIPVVNTIIALYTLFNDILSGIGKVFKNIFTMPLVARKYKSE